MHSINKDIGLSQICDRNAKRTRKCISNYVIVIYIIQNLKYRNNSIGQQLSTITNNLLNGELCELNEKTNVHYKKMRARLHI